MSVVEVVRTDSLVYERCDGNDDLLILVSGFNAGFAEPEKFHFQATLGELPINKLYIRDCFGLWYHGGLAGHTSCISETAEFLDGFVRDWGFSSVRLLGVSAGGYAALLFGALLGAETIVTLAPRTFLDWPNRHRTGDVRLLQACRRLHAAPSAEPRFFDLREVLAAWPLRSRYCALHYDPSAQIDPAHADHLEGVPGIEFVRHSGAGHVVGPQLVKDECLKRRLIGLEPEPVAASG